MSTAKLSGMNWLEFAYLPEGKKVTGNKTWEDVAKKLYITTENGKYYKVEQDGKVQMGLEIHPLYGYSLRTADGKQAIKHADKVPQKALKLVPVVHIIQR